MKRCRCKLVEPAIRKQSIADHICAAARNPYLALKMWRLHVVSLCREVVRLIPESRAAHALLQDAKHGRAFPLCNHISIQP